MGNTQEQNEPADKAQCPEQSTVPKNSGQIYTCTDCGLTGCRKEDGNYPPFCLTMQTESGELDEIAALYASDSIDGTIARASAKIEGNYYCRKTRVEETVLFIKAIGAKRVGIATCAGLINEAKTFSKILKKNGIDHVSVICKVDSLNLNPARVKKILTEHGYRAYGRFPNRKNRNGKEQVSYEQFYEELINSCCGANLLTYIGRVSLKELYEADFSLKEVIIPKGNCCGLFSSTYGGGSLLEMELKRDVKLKLEVKDYHGFRFRLDDERSKYDCSVRHVYGVDDSFFGDAVRIVS